MSTGRFNCEATLELSGEYAMSAKDASVVATILAKATRVNHRWQGSGSAYRWELQTQQPISVTYHPLADQATMSMELSDTPTKE